MTNYANNVVFLNSIYNKYLKMLSVEVVGEIYHIYV